MAIDQIPSGLIKDNAVTTAKILDDNVTGAKIENNPTIAGNLTTVGSILPSADDAVDLGSSTIQWRNI